MSVFEHLSLPVDTAVWTLTNRNDPALVALADRHYSRQKPGSPQMGAPGSSLAFVTPCRRAGWLTQWTHHPDDGLFALRCAFFRNEGDGLSSELVAAAMRLTEDIWNPFGFAVFPQDGWVTFVKPKAVKSSNPGYCFKVAGWCEDPGWNPARGRRGLIRLRHRLLTAGLPSRSANPFLSDPES